MNFQDFKNTSMLTIFFLLCFPNISSGQFAGQIPLEIEDQSVEFFFEVSGSTTRQKRMEICLVDQSGIDQKKQLRIAGVDINVSQRNPVSCKIIDSTGGRGQFRWLIRGARHVGYAYVPPDQFSGQRITFIWSKRSKQ